MIFRCTDSAKIRKMITDPEYLDKTAQDGMSLDNVQINPGHIFLTETEREFVVFIPVSPCAVRIHGNAKPKGIGAHIFFAGCIQWAWDNLSVFRIETEIPFLFPATRNFISKHGFESEGVSKKSFIKDGHLYDSWRMGLTR